MTNANVHGPVDVLVLEFAGDAEAAQTALALRDLVDSGTLRLYDLMVVTTDAAGNGTEIDLSESDGPLAALTVFSGARSGLLTAEDVAQAAEVLEPGKAGVVLVYENAWAIPFVGAARGEGGQMVASTRRSAQAIMDALDAAEAAD